MLDSVSRAAVVVQASVVRRTSIYSSFSEIAAWIQAKYFGKVPIRHISRLFFSIFFIFKVVRIFSFWLTWDPMGAKISKSYFSQNFDPISPKLYDKYDGHGGIQAITFLPICQKLTVLWHFEHFVNKGPYRPVNFKTVPLLQFSTDVGQIS